MKIEYQGKTQDWANGETTYWFDVEGTVYGLVDDGYSEWLVDSEGVRLRGNKDWQMDLLDLCVVTKEMKHEN